ncbi:hypothetical protein BY996DRAFT_6440681 [Phakopsora pachyrhizi]|nr:hypothetical protein BY996DRAFT_6440681 [Phakopsora pachyrhizi]
MSCGHSHNKSRGHGRVAMQVWTGEESRQEGQASELGCCKRRATWAGAGAVTSWSVVQQRPELEQRLIPQLIGPFAV